MLINRALNAIGRNGLLRLAEVNSTSQTSDKEVTDLIDDLIYSEEILRDTILPHLGLPSATQSQAMEQLATGEVLKQHWHNFGTYERWQELQEYYFLPRVKGVFQFLRQQGSLGADISSWLNLHQEKLEVLLEAVSSSYRQEAAKRCGQIKRGLSSVDREWSESGTLSQMAIRALRTTTGIATVLVGMRREAYVDDVLEELSRPMSTKDKTESWYKLRDYSFIPV